MKKRKLTKKQANRNRGLGKAVAKWKRDFPRLRRTRKLTKTQAKSVYEAGQKLIRDAAQLEDFSARNKEMCLLRRKAGKRLSRLAAKHVAAMWLAHDEERVLTVADMVKIRDLFVAIIKDKAVAMDKEFFITLGRCFDDKCTPKILTNNLHNAAVAMYRLWPDLGNPSLLKRLEEAGHTVASKGQIRQIRHDLLHTRK
jgi:hypothetical protein